MRRVRSRSSQISRRIKIKKKKGELRRSVKRLKRKMEKGIKRKEGKDYRWGYNTGGGTLQMGAHYSEWSITDVGILHFAVQ